MTSDLPAPSPTLKYLVGLTPEQRKAAVQALPKHEQARIVQELCAYVKTAVRSILDNKEAHWDTATRGTGANDE